MRPEISEIRDCVPAVYMHYIQFLKEYIESEFWRTKLFSCVKDGKENDKLSTFLMNYHALRVRTVEV